VFPKENEFSDFLQENVDGELVIHHSALGANLYRYSVDYEKSWSSWAPYEDVTELKLSSMDDLHVTIEYWSEILASAVHRSTAAWTRGASLPPEQLNRYPSIFVQGDFNLFGNDLGLDSQMKLETNGLWTFTIQGTFPTNITLDIYNDNVFMFGEVDHDGILDRLPPAAQDRNHLHIPPPPTTYTAWVLVVNDRKMTWSIYPTGSGLFSMIYVIALGVVPLISAVVSVFFFKWLFYPTIVNKTGRPDPVIVPIRSQCKLSKVLIATLEYEIPEWDIKVRIGGLGTIAGLLGTRLPNEVIWIVPKVGDVKYPPPQQTNYISVVVCNETYSIGVEKYLGTHATYYLLESPIFKCQSSKEPYPTRMDDIYSAVYYSCWNQVIAAILIYEDPDIYHVNDFHGALAPLYLMPERTIPIVLSLHNSEFQGLWPLRNTFEKQLFSSIFHLPVEVVDSYICFGHTFNMLHAAATYIAVHQEGIGAGGVSVKYGERCQKRYAILWGLTEMERLQNPNPSDSIHSASPALPLRADKEEAIRLAQEWAGLELVSDATILVFVGRLSHQKGIDLIADLASDILNTFPKVQLICIGPIIDLFAKLAVEKLQMISLSYPGRVYCKPEFTKIPECIYRAAEFVLIPSRDEPFGLVAVEFGRKGVLGIGSYVGGLGTMGGWWYPIESSENRHLLSQFWNAIVLALSSKPDERARMVQNAAKHMFPIEEWIENTLKVYEKVVQFDRKHSEYSSRQDRLIQEINSQTSLILAKKELLSHSEKLLELIERLKVDSGCEEFPQFLDEDLEYFSRYQSLLRKNKAPPIQEFLCSAEKEFFQNVQIEQRLQDINGNSFFRRIAIRAMQTHVLGWPIYTICLLLGQLLSSTSFQIALLADSATLKQWQFYAMGGVFIVASIMWFVLYRCYESRLVLSLPFLLFGISFLSALMFGPSLISTAPLLLYTVGSAALPYYFALNFGQESGSQISLWIFRAMIGETCRQVWTSSLFFWNYVDTKDPDHHVVKSPMMIAIISSCSVILGLLGVLLYFGLPRVYLQIPPTVPRFWRNLMKRKLVLWYWLSEVVKTYFLSGVFGRNMSFLWAHPLDNRSTLYIALIFQAFGLLCLGWMAYKSSTHSWVLPIFAVGLLSPRWSQMALSTSLMGFYLPWSGDLGPYVGISLWLWLAVMDTIQSAGLMIMLLQTLTRIHVVPVLVVGQCLGAAVQMISKLTAPNRDGPGDIFPAFSSDIGPLKNPLFWLGWISQVFISLGFLFWFRREQLSKP
jgi:glycogen synthase